MNDSATLNLIVVGYLVGLPFAVYGVVDVARIPARLYQFTPYSRPVWLTTIITGYACVGIGAIFMLAAWLRSPERADLRDDLALDARWEIPALPAGLPTRAMRRRERTRRHRWAAIAVSLPVVLAVAATVTRVG
jgi:hypothetical protein